jgi:hypothetical protein
MEMQCPIAKLWSCTGIWTVRATSSLQGVFLGAPGRWQLFALFLAPFPGTRLRLPHSAVEAARGLFIDFQSGYRLLERLSRRKMSQQTPDYDLLSLRL